MSLFDRDWKSPTVLFEMEFDAHPNRDLVLKIVECSEQRRLYEVVVPIDSQTHHYAAAHGLTRAWLSLHKHRVHSWAAKACVHLLSHPESRYLLELHPNTVNLLAASGNTDAQWVLEAVEKLHEGEDDEIDRSGTESNASERV